MSDLGAVLPGPTFSMSADSVRFDRDPGSGQNGHQNLKAELATNLTGNLGPGQCGHHVRFDRGRGPGQRIMFDLIATLGPIKTDIMSEHHVRFDRGPGRLWHPFGPNGCMIMHCASNALIAAYLIWGLAHTRPQADRATGFGNKDSSHPG